MNTDTVVDKATPRPWRVEKLEWSPVQTAYVGRILFKKFGRKETEHSLGSVALKDHFSHPDNPDFEPFVNLSDIDCNENAKFIERAVNAYDSLREHNTKLLTALKETYIEIHLLHSEQWVEPVEFDDCTTRRCVEARAVLAANKEME